VIIDNKGDNDLIETIYIEQAVEKHPNTLRILGRFPDARIISCHHYGEIFNRKNQNFRLQKTQPAMILARKQRNLVLDAPAGYGIGGKRNYYFSHMLNCIYDCRYCFLQGMYRSAHYVVFVNYEDFSTAVLEKINHSRAEGCYFFSGYDCDSLALEPVTRFAEHYLPLFRRNPEARIELRTKSTQVRGLLKTDPFPNCIVAFSFTPAELSETLEQDTPSVARRLAAMEKLQQHGWRLGLRFDPLIYEENFRQSYARLFDTVFERIHVENLHSVSLGMLRFPETYFRNITRLYPDERLFSGPFEKRQGMVRYRSDIEHDMRRYCGQLLSRHIPDRIFYPCENAA
jgi:spore photoproduct lyase